MLWKQQISDWYIYRVSQSWTSRNSLQLLVYKNRQVRHLSKILWWGRKKGRYHCLLCNCSLHGPQIYHSPCPCPHPHSPHNLFYRDWSPLSPPPLCHPWYRVVHWTNYSLILVSCSLNAFLCLHLSVEKKGLDRLLISNTPNLYGDLINSNTFYQPPDTKIKCLWVNAWVSKHSYKTTSTCLLSQVVSESVGIH